MVYLNNEVVNSSTEVSTANCDNLEKKDEDHYFYQNVTTAFDFHERLKVVTYERIDDVRKYFIENIGSIKSQYGVLLFLYSVIYTKVSFSYSVE